VAPFFWSESFIWAEDLSRRPTRATYVKSLLEEAEKACWQGKTRGTGQNKNKTKLKTKTLKT
jgi:hypothetical protein